MRISFIMVPRVLLTVHLRGLNGAHAKKSEMAIFNPPLSSIFSFHLIALLSLTHLLFSSQYFSFFLKMVLLANEEKLFIIDSYAKNPNIKDI